MSNKKYFCQEQFAKRVYLVLFYCLLLGFILYLPLLINKITTTHGNLEIYVSSYSDVISENIFRKFEAESGIKVISKYCDQDSEMWTQLYMNSEHGYDLITPTDYMVKIMARDNLLQPINTELLENYKNIDPLFLGLKNDPKNEFSVPFSWSVHGIGFRESFFLHKKHNFYPDSLAAIFTPEDFFGKKTLKSGDFKNYRISLIDEPMELIFLASIFLFGNVDDFSPPRLEKIKEVLIKQRKWTRAYTSSDVFYYLAHCSQVVLALAAHVKKAMDSNDKYKFQIPKEGGTLVIQHFCIPKESKNPHLALKLIDFILRPENQAEIFDRSGFAPVNNDAKPLIDQRYVKNKNFFPPPENFSKLFMLNDKLAVDQAEELLLAIKTD